MAAAGVPVVPGETPDDQSDRGVRRAVERVGLPALVKASAGGGGKGMRRVREAGEIDEAIQAARREAIAAFGDGTLYVERLVERPRHVEVQIFADDHGHVVHLFERECSAQRRHQKVIEESPSPALTPALRARMTEAAVAAARAAGYRNAGTIEFLVDRRTATIALLLPRDEHAAAGRASGHRAGHRARSRARAAAGRLRRAAAVDAGRRSASAATRSKRASTPRIRRRASCRRPAGSRATASRSVPGVRVDSGVAEGGEVSVHYDPMLAKVIATAETRDARDRAPGGRAARVPDRAASARTAPFLIADPRDPTRSATARSTPAFLDREGAGVSRESSVAGIESAVAQSNHDQSAIRSPQSPVHGSTRGIAGARSGSRRKAPAAGRAPRAADVRRGRTLHRAPMPATVIKVHGQARRRR